MKSIPSAMVATFLDIREAAREATEVGNHAQARVHQEFLDELKANLIESHGAEAVGKLEAIK